jgi:hypothetical protein
MKAKKNLFAMFALVCAMVFSVSFSSCSKDDDDETLLYYSLGFSQMDGNFTEAAVIDDAFKEALGVTSDTFTSYPGGDEKIKSNCEKAASKLNKTAFTGSYTYAVSKYTSKGISTVYTWTNPSN